MKTIATAARHDVDGCSSVAPILSRKVGRLDLDLFDKVDTYVVDLAVVAAGIHIEAAINCKAVIVGTVPIDGRLADAQAGSQRQLIFIEYHRAGN